MSRKTLTEYETIKKYSKFVVLIQTEQISRNETYLSGFLQEQNFCDVVVETLYEQVEFTKSQTDKPVLFMPFGYDEMMTYFDENDHHLDFDFDVFKLEKDNMHPNRIQIYKTLDDHNIKYFKGVLWNLKKIGFLANHSRVCMTAHSYGKDSCLAVPRLTGHFFANKAFVLVQRSNYPFFNDNEHLVYYDTCDDLMDKIEYYSKNQDVSRKIALAGYNFVKKSFRMDAYLKNLISEIQKIRGAS